MFRESHRTVLVPLLVFLSFCGLTMDAGAQIRASVTIQGAEQVAQVWDSGSVTVTANGYSGTVSYGQYSTAASIASALGSRFSEDCNSPVNARAFGATLTFQLKSSQTASTITITSSVTYDSNDFSQSSFQVPPATATLLWSNPNPSAYGQQVQLSAQVIGTGPSSPTGTLTFQDGGTAIGNGSLASSANTNLLLYSSQFSNAVWSPSGIITPNYAATPMGDDTGVRLQPPTGGQGQPESIQQQVMGLGGQTVTFSIWMESNTSSNQSVQLTVTDEYGTPWGNTGCFAAPGAWQRCSATASIPASSQSQWASLTVNPQADVSLWGAQLEVASSAGGYVPTAGSPVTGNVFLTAFSASGLTGGENLITAAYGGDNNNTASTSTALSQTVNLVQITTPLPLLNGVVDTSYSVTLSAAGGTPPYTWQLIGSLPQGLSLDPNAGVISGTPLMGTSALPFSPNFIIQVTDSSTPANTAAMQMNIQILNPLMCPDPSYGCPTPQIYGVYPNQAVAGTNGLTVTVYGCFPGTADGVPTPTIGPLPSGVVSASNTYVSPDSVVDTLNISPSAQSGTDQITAQQTFSCGTTTSNALPFNIYSPISQQPSTLNMSTGSENKIISVTVGSGNEYVVYSWNLSANPNSTCAAQLQASGNFGPVSGTTPYVISASGNNCTNSPSGIFNMLFCLQNNAICANPATTITVPPQIIIQMMDAEAGGTGNGILMQGLGISLRNRFTSGMFDSQTTSWQTAQILWGIQQFATTDITPGTDTELNAAATVFAGNGGNWCGSLAFWSPSPGQWANISAAINNGTTAFPFGTGAPTYDPNVWSTGNQQIIYDSAVGIAGGGQPNFVFLAPRELTAAAAVSASCH